MLENQIPLVTRAAFVINSGALVYHNVVEIAVAGITLGILGADGCFDVVPDTLVTGEAVIGSAEFIRPGLVFGDQIGIMTAGTIQLGIWHKGSGMFGCYISVAGFSRIVAVKAQVGTVGSGGDNTGSVKFMAV